MPPQLKKVPERERNLVLLGTVAGPVLHPRRMMSSQASWSDGAIYLFDCGYGALVRMAAAGLRLADIRAVFITHHHSDHKPTRQPHPSRVDTGPHPHAAVLGRRRC